MAEGHALKFPDGAKTRLLILGGSGFIGQRALAALGPARATATYFSHPFAGGHRFNLVTDNVGDLLDRLPSGYSHALVLGASTMIDACALDPVGTARINVDGVIRAADALMAHGIVPIVASSDAVYDGSRGGWSETDVVRPITEYGRQKLTVEQHLQACDRPWLGLRICKVLDPGLGPTGLLGPWLDDFRRRVLIRCATDQWFTPVGIDDVIAVCVALADTGATGLFNVGGGEAVARFDLLGRLVKAARHYADIDPEIEPRSLRSFDFIEPRPLNASVSIAKLQAQIPYKPESLDSLCSRAAANFYRS